REGLLRLGRSRSATLWGAPSRIAPCELACQLLSFTKKSGPPVRRKLGARSASIGSLTHRDRAGDGNGSDGIGLHGRPGTDRLWLKAGGHAFVLRGAQGSAQGAVRLGELDVGQDSKRRLLQVQALL